MHHSVCSLSVQSERAEEGAQGRLHELRQLYTALPMSIILAFSLLPFSNVLSQGWLQHIQ